MPENQREWAFDILMRIEKKLYRSLLKNGDKILYTIDKD